MAGIGGYNGWRWIFILEGLFTVCAAIFSFFFIPDWPEEAKFLTATERELLIHRLAVENGPARMSTWNKKAARLTFYDPKIWLGTLAYLGIVNSGYSISFFTPTILSQLGWTSIRAQVMSIPIYIVATVLCLTTAILADTLKHRFAFTVIGCCIATIGYAILLNMHHVPVGARYFAVYAITGGGYITQPVVLAWLSNQLGGHYKRGIGPAVQIGIGNIGGIIASNIYLKDQAPTYQLGFGLSLGLIWLCCLSCIALFAFLVTENRLREKGGRDYRLQGLTEEEQENLGDAHPGFRFSY